MRVTASVSIGWRISGGTPPLWSRALVGIPTASGGALTTAPVGR